MKKLTARIFTCVFTLFILTQPVRGETLIPVGQVIGLELGCGYLSVADFEEKSPAKAAGLQVGDRILRIDEKSVSSMEDIRRGLTCSDGTVRLTVLRGGKEKTFSICPAITEHGPKLGMYLQQSISGVGTVTYYDPEEKTFGALGHGVNTQDGQLAEMVEGNAYNARVDGVRKGRIGEPGQLMGALTVKTPLGPLTKNTPQGIFGTCRQGFAGELLPTADAREIKTGPATIRSTVEGSAVREYSVEILKVYPDSAATGRNLLLKITDDRLLSTTGGIVQGMSGSPIIQDGKLVGAVTHVLVNDPTTGYGIFIENMLDAAA